MTSEIEPVPCKMKLVERSYSTELGWRLATFQEANHNLEMIKQQEWEWGWERARLLDGWISGPCHNFQIGDDFKNFLGYMLVIQIQPSVNYSSGNSGPARSIYADVTLTDKGREVALFLCLYDWNYEVVYWVLNSWEKRETFNSPYVREGNIPFCNRTTFVEMNRMICHVARILGEEGLGSKKAARRKLSRDSVNEVMVTTGKSCWDKFSQEHKKIMGRTCLKDIDSLGEYFSEDEELSKVNWFQEFASQEDTLDDIWNLLWYIISSEFVEGIIQRSLAVLIKELENKECQMRCQRDFIMSTSVLYCLSEGEWSVGSNRILKQVCKDAAGDDRQRFNDTLKNPSSAYYDKTGNYHLLNKILISAVWNENSILVNKVLEWGAQPQANLGPERWNMALYNAIDNENKEIIKSLFDKCHSKEELANAADEKGMTALHWACKYYIANVSICEMVLEYGGRPDVADNRGRLPLHYAVERGKTDVIDVLIGEGNSDTVQSQSIYKRRADMVSWKDKDGVSPLDMAVKDNHIKLMVKLLSVSEQALETYFGKVDSAKLLHEFASEGNAEVVEKLLERGADPLACNEQGQTALHHACVCENRHNAGILIDLMLKKFTSDTEKKKWVIKQDARGKTALHVAAMKGHRGLFYKFLKINEDILQIRDTDGRIPLYEAVSRGHDDASEALIDCLFWRRIEIDYDSIIDRSGLTPLHVAVSEGRTYIADYLLRKSKKPKVYVRTPDVLGQTALHKAAKGGHADIIKVLLHWGAHPLLERDCDGRTVLHYFAQTLLTGEDGKAVAELLLKKCGSDEKKLLLLWASAAGLGTADQHLSDSPLKTFLLQQKKRFTEKEGKKNNLLRTAACLGDIEITKELLTRGAQIGDIKDDKWIKSLKSKDKNNVDTVCQQIQSITEQGNDQPTTSDNLGRSDFAHGLAALLLNPYLKPPITVGISGSWGMGKSSLMIQTEGILLKTAAQLALLPSEMTSSSFPGFQILEHTEKGKKKYRQIETSIDLLLDDIKLKNSFFPIMKSKIIECWMKIKNIISGKTTKEGDSLRNFLKKYDAKYHHIFKSLAAMNSSGMFQVKGEQSESEIDSPTKESVVSCSLLKRKAQQSESEIYSPTEGSVPAILTVRYNAWKYRNESEALAGMAVEITKGMEGIMTDAQWLSTCLRNTWRKQKQVIWIEIIFPCLLAVLLATSFTWILWLVLDRYKIKESLELKYASFPLTVVIMVWTLVKKVMNTVNPVSVQLMNYIKLPDHTEKLGYQERVISDITFLKEEISKKPYFLCTAASYIWHFITGTCIISLLSSKYSGENLASPIPSANLRTIVFVDDLDRCQESVILQVLSAINLVLAVCEISVVLGMDKELIQRAIIKKHGDKTLRSSKLADKYLQKIIQLPLDLPDPSIAQSKNFLKGQLGVFKKPSKERHMKSEADGEDSITEIDEAYNALFSPFDRSFDYEPDFQKMLTSATPISETSSSAETTKPPPQKQTAETIAIDMQGADGTNSRSSLQTTNKTEAPPQPDAAQDVSNIGCFWSRLRKLFCINRKIKALPQSDAAGDASSSLQTTNEKEALPQSDAAEGNQSFSEFIPIRELLFVRYSEGERDAFCHFQEMATDFRKLPREWKRFLNYHRLVWYIFLINNEAKDLDGWQVQLITWIFICWEFEDNINILVKGWNRIGLLKTYKSEAEEGSDSQGWNRIGLLKIYKSKAEEGSKSESEQEPEKSKSGPSGPSLRAIVEHCINKESWIIASNKDEKITETCNERDTATLSKGSENKNPPTEKSKEKVPEKDATESKNIEDPESSKKGKMDVKESVNDQTMPVRDDTKGGDYSEISEVASTENLITFVEEKNVKLEKKLLMELDALKKEIQELKDLVISQQVDKKEIQELKDLVNSQQVGKKEKKGEEKKLKLQSWQRLKFALRKYDVSMDGIQAFQRFRFYCDAGHLPWP